MAKDVQKTIPVRPAYQVNKGPVKCESGLGTTYVATAIYDSAALDSAGVSNSTIAAHGTGVFLPTRAIIKRAWFQVVTAFTSATNAGTIALSVQSANDLKTATAVSNAIYGTAIITDGVPVDSAATRILLTAQRELVATVAVEALTAGKLVLFVEYVIAV